MISTQDAYVIAAAVVAGSVGLWVRTSLRYRRAINEQRELNEKLQTRFRDLIAEAKAKEGFMRQVIDAVPHRIFVKNRQGRFLLVNKARAAASKLRVEQLEGRMEKEVNPRKEQVAAFQRADAEVMESRVEMHIPEEQVTNTPGVTLWLETVKTPLIGSDGTCNAVLGVSTDITQRKRTELLLNSVLENLPVAVFMKEAKDLRFVLWNRANEQLCGVSKAEVIGKCDHELFPKEQAERFNASDRDALEAGKLVEVEEQILTRHKGIRIFRTRKIPILDEDGHPLHLLGISEDVTDRRKAESELARQQAMLEALMDSSPDCIYFKDAHSRFARVSRAFSRFGDVEAMIGKTDFDLFQEAHARPAFEDEQRIMRTGEPIVGKVEQEVLLDGSERWALTSKMPWRAADGTIMGTFGISKDITAIKQAEAQLATAHRQLVETSRQAGMAEVATSVLHNVGNVLNSINVSASVLAHRIKTSKIAQLSKVSALLAEHRSDLGAFLSRDARGKQLPSYIGQLSEILAKDQAFVLEELESLIRNVDHVKDVVATQQSYAKVSGLIEPLSPTDLIDDAIRMNASSIEKHELHVVREFAPGLPQINADKHKVLQILVNLIRNAKFACSESGRCDGRILVAAHPSHEADRVLMKVSDNGVGIPADNLTRIFQHGFTTRAHGHGFGLHSSVLAARQMGGDLRVYSEGPGKGATFTLELPLASPKSS